MAGCPPVRLVTSVAISIAVRPPTEHPENDSTFITIGTVDVD
jgi:hypothetical protein